MDGDRLTGGTGQGSLLGDVWTTSSLVGDVTKGHLNGDGLPDFRILVNLNWGLQAADLIL